MRFFCKKRSTRILNGFNISNFNALPIASSAYRVSTNMVIEHAKYTQSFTTYVCSEGDGRSYCEFRSQNAHSHGPDGPGNDGNFPDIELAEWTYCCEKFEICKLAVTEFTRM